MNTETQSQMPPLFVEMESRYQFDEAVEKLSLEIEKQSWEITAVHDLQKSMIKHDFQVLPIKVLAVCHPKFAKILLAKDDERIVSPMMPCRISIYEKSDGHTYISLPNTLMMAQMLGGVIEEVMKLAAQEVEKMVKTVTKG